MKKNLLIALFATATMAGAAEAYTPVGTYTPEVDTIDVSEAKIAGNWTMDIKLNNETLTAMFRTPASGSETSESGNSLFTVEGSASRSIGGKRANEDGLATTFVMGWGSGWYVTQNTGVSSGVQIGVTDKTGNPKNLGEDKVISGLVPTDHSSFDVYRFNTQANGSKHTLNDWIGWDPIPEWDVIEVSNATVTDSRLTVTHSVNADGSSQTSISLTLDYEYDRRFAIWSDTVEGSVTYTASIDDTSNNNVPVGSAFGGSAFYDVDDLTKISGINGEFVTSMDVYDKALVVGADGNLVPQNPDTPGGDTPGAAVPEPTTATLSLLALAGLCARRRRR